MSKVYTFLWKNQAHFNGSPIKPGMTSLRSFSLHAMRQGRPELRLAGGALGGTPLKPDTSRNADSSPTHHAFPVKRNFYAKTQLWGHAPRMRFFRAPQDFNKAVVRFVAINTCRAVGERCAYRFILFIQRAISHFVELVTK